MEFGKRLALRRNEKGLTQKQLGEVLGTTERNIRFYEGGDRVPGVKTLIAIADYFKVSLDFLVGRSARREQL